MKRLINQGANVNEIEGREYPSGGKPVLRYAIDSGCLKAVQVLLAAGANPNEFTVSPIIIQSSPHTTNNSVRNLSLLCHAVNSKAPIAIINELLKYGAHVDGSPKISGDWSALMVAAYRGYKEAVEILLTLDKEPNRVNSYDSKTALDYAKEQNHEEIVKILLLSIP